MTSKCINNVLQNAYIRRYTLTGGLEDGLKVIEVNNGKIRFLLNESRALDIMQLWHKETNISFVSKNGFTSCPSDFLGRFEGGMLYTCGLDSISGQEGYVTHGLFHLIPANVTSIKNDGETLEVTAEMYQTNLFGRELTMQRKYTTQIGSDSVTLIDKLINKGFRDEPCALMYHINVGYPMLDDGVTVIAPAPDDKIIPTSEHAKECIKDRTCFPAPIDNEPERCYYLQNAPGRVGVINKKLGKQFYIDYSTKTLPGFVQWVSPASHDYALGLEPAGALLGNGNIYFTVKPQEEIDYEVILSVSEL